MAPIRDRLEFENGRLVKVDGARPEYMDGYALIRLVRELAAEVHSPTGKTVNLIDAHARLFAELGEPEYKLARWAHGSDPFHYWSREAIETALSQIASPAGERIRPAQDEAMEPVPATGQPPVGAGSHLSFIDNEDRSGEAA